MEFWSFYFTNVIFRRGTKTKFRIMKKYFYIYFTFIFIIIFICYTYCNFCRKKWRACLKQQLRTKMWFASHLQQGEQITGFSVQLLITTMPHLCLSTQKQVNCRKIIKPIYFLLGKDQIWTGKIMNFRSNIIRMEHYNEFDLWDLKTMTKTNTTDHHTYRY